MTRKRDVPVVEGVVAESVKPTVVESIPSVAGQISAVASANAPFLYFEDVAFYGLVGGVGKITLSVSRQIAPGPGGTVLNDTVLVGHLVGNLAAMQALMRALNGVVLMASPPADGKSH